ncbi:MAG: DUF4340 domain-containing protein [Treponema sp.]|nr:DUF4340 domain-containing protein [Treponema sp.]
MKARKIVLLTADVILLVVCIVQFILSKKDNVKTFTITDNATEILIEKADGDINLVKENDNWFIGDKKYPANQSSVDVLLDAASSVRALDRMGSASNENVIAKYELGEGKNITVTVKNGDKTLRVLKIGKESSTGTQSYITVDGGSDVYLISSNLRSSFSKSVDDLRSKNIFTLDKNSISGVSVVEPDESTWTVRRSGEGENLAWTLSGTDVEEKEVDGAATTDWFNTLATLSTTKWYDIGEVSGSKERTLKIFSGNKTVTVDLYSIEAEKPTYYAICSETPYPFEIPSYSVQKFQKKLVDVLK